MSTSSPGDLDLEARVLCSDGACIGVIGENGCCRECGKAAPSESAAAASRAVDAEPSTVDSEDWERRRLCTDGSCIGVIGSDNCCKECGKPYAP